MAVTKAEISAELSLLYFLNSQERDDLLSKLDHVPREALREILDVIKNSKKKQKEFFSRINKIDPQFIKKLEIFVEGRADDFIAESLISKW